MAFGDRKPDRNIRHRIPKPPDTSHLDEQTAEALQALAESHAERLEEIAEYFLVFEDLEKLPDRWREIVIRAVERTPEVITVRREQRQLEAELARIAELV